MNAHVSFTAAINGDGVMTPPSLDGHDVDTQRGHDDDH
jgi:hypothetical protein